MALQREQQQAGWRFGSPDTTGLTFLCFNRATATVSVRHEAAAGSPGLPAV